MTKMIFNRILSFIVLTLLLMSLSWVDKMTMLHVMAIPIYLSCLPFIWLASDWLTGVNRTSNS